MKMSQAWAAQKDCHRQATRAWVIFHYDALAPWRLAHSAWHVGTTQHTGVVTTVMLWFLMR